MLVHICFGLFQDHEFKNKNKIEIKLQKWQTSQVFLKKFGIWLPFEQSGIMGDNWKKIIGAPHKKKCKKEWL